MTDGLPLDEAVVSAVVTGWYGVTPTRFDRLAGGLDTSASSYRVTDQHVLRISRGPVLAAGLLVPRALSDAGLTAVLAPIPTRDGALGVSADDLTWTLTPYAEGTDGWGGRMTADHWYRLGRLLAQIHAAALDPALLDLVPLDAARAEVYDGWHAVDAEVTAGGGPLGGAWRRHRSTMRTVLAQAHVLGPELRARPRPVVLCHGDLHPGNVLVAPGRLHVLDWDFLVRAPRERDFVFAPVDPDSAFLAGYGAAAVDWAALTYYRCERVLQDVLEFARTAVDDEAGAARWIEHVCGPGSEAQAAREAAARLPPDLDILAR